MKFSKKNEQRTTMYMYIMHSVQLASGDLVESLVFFLGGTLTSVSLTVTQFSLLAVDSLLEALLDALGDAELLLKDTSMFLVRAHALSILAA